MSERPDELHRRFPGESGYDRDTAQAGETGRAGGPTGNGEVEQIRGEIEETRTEMSETIDAIQERLSPQQLREQATETVREATIGRVGQTVGSAGQTARGASATMLETLKQNPVSNRIQGLVGTYFGSQGESFRLAPGQRVILRATKRVSEGISGGSGQGGLFGIGAAGSLLAVGAALGAAWFARRRQAERNRPINRLRRTASEIGTEIGTRVPRGEEIAQYLPDREVAAEVAREAAGRLRGRGRGLTLLALGVLVGWALRGRRLRTTEVTTTSELRRGDVAVARQTDVRTTLEPGEDVTPC